MALDPTNFTDLVEQFVRGSIRRPTDTLGIRRTDVSFTDIQEAAASVFLLYPQASLYVVYLAAQRLLELIAAEEQIILQLLDLIQATGRTVSPIKDLSTLSNITSALQELESAITTRSQGFSNIENVPAFQRFDNNVNQFLDSYGRNVKSGGNLVDTPQGARDKIPQLVVNLQQSHAEIVRKATLVRNGISNFSALNLPASVASSVVSSSRQVIQARNSSLGVADEVGRLSQNLDVVQELLASRALVRRYGSLSRPESVFAGNITGSPFSDVGHPAVSGSLRAERDFYIPVPSRDVLDFYLDGPASPKFSGVVDVVRNGIYEAKFNLGVGGFDAAGVVPGDVVYMTSGSSQKSKWTVINADDFELETTGVEEVVPEAGVTVEVWRTPDESVATLDTLAVGIDGLSTEPMVFNRSAPSGQPDNWVFRVNVLGTMAEVHTVLVPGTSINVSWGGDIHLGQLCSSLNSQLAPLIAPEIALFEPYFSPPGADGEVVFTFVSGTTFRATIAAGNWDTVGIQATGWYVKIMTGPNKGKFYKITAVDGSSPVTTVDFDTISGVLDITNSQRIQIGKLPRIRLYYPDQYLAVATPKYLTLDSGYANSAAFTLGMAEGRTIVGQAIKARLMAEDVNAKGDRVSATSTLDPIVTSSARTDPLGPTTLVLSKLSGVGAVVASGPTFILSVADVDLSGVGVGDWVVYRTSNPINAVHTVVSKTDTTLTTTGTSIADQTSVGFDVGDVLVPAANGYYTITVADGPNSGTYDVLGRGATVLDFTVTPQIPLRQTITADPVTVQATLGKEYVVFSSRATDTNASIIIHGSEGHEFFSVLPTARAQGTTAFLKLTATPTGLQPGDLLEYYPSDYAHPSETFTLQSVDFTNNLISVDPPSPVTRTYSITQDSPPPFALLRVAQVLSTNGLENNLQTWLDEQVNTTAFFQDLNRFINPLIVNSNPTAVQVADAGSKVKELYDLLNIAGDTLDGFEGNNLETILDGYKIDAQAPVDTLLNSFKEKGGDRALDILLEANFSGFFGLDVDTSSYAGTMLKSMRDLAREDLAIRKVDRLETQQSQLISSTESEDFEFSGSDVEGGVKVPTG